VRGSRWLIFAPVALFAIYAKPVKADVLGDWEYSQSAACGGSVEVVDNTITLHGPDQNGCSGAAHWVKIETTIPADVNTVDFTWSYQTTDGWVYDPPQYGINGVYTLITQQNNASGTKSVPVNEGDIFTFRQYSIDTCCSPGHLTISNLSLWEFTATTTTTEVSTTTIQESTTTTNVSTTTVAVTTTVESTTTSSVPTSTSLAPEPTMPEPSTTTTSTTSSSTTTSTTQVPTTTTSTTTTSTVVPTTTTTEPVSPPIAQPPVVVQPEPIELPTIEEMEPIPVVIEPVEEALPYETSETYPTVETPDTLPFVGVTEPDFVDDLPDLELPVIDEPAVDIIIPETLPDAPEAPLSDAELETILDTIETVEALTEALEELTSEQAEQLIEAILEEEPTQEQATAIASSPAALAVLSSDQATQVFEALDVTELDNIQLEALAEAVTDAPTEVKEAFEDSVDIFSEGLGTYVPVDSKIPVSERQTLIAIAAGATLTAASTRMRR
jgi:hypothetical protein